MKKYGSLALIVVLSTLTILPAVVGFPTTLGYFGARENITFLLLGIVVLFDFGVLVLAMRKSEDARRHLRKAMTWLATTSVIARALLALDVHIPVIVIPTPHILAPLLHVDGQYAYESDVFEIYCELWLLVAVILGLTVLGLRYKKRPPLTS